MELRQLRYVVTLAEELHFGRAAEREHIAQPAFSQQVMRLEQELGVQLFDRTSRRVGLTEPGRMFVDLARGVLDRADDAVVLVRQASRGKEGRLRLAYANGTDRGVPATVVDRFRAERPRVELTLSTQYDEEARLQLRSGAIDAAFFWMPLGDYDDLVEVGVATETLVAAVGRHHHLASLEQLTPDQIAAEPLVWFARHWSPGSWDTIIEAVFLRHGLAPSIVIEEVSQEGMVRGVVATGGVTVVTESTARQLSLDDVVYRPFEDPSPTVDIGLAWRVDDSSPIVKALVEIAEQLAAPARGSEK